METENTRSIHVPLHPDSLKHIKKGHQWIIKDRFTEKFPKKERLLIAKNKRDEGLFIFLHDPKHPKVKGRVWSYKKPLEVVRHDFKNELYYRLKQSFTQRMTDKIFEERDNFYILSAELDNVPGLCIQYLGGMVLIQSYCSAWDFYKDFIISTTVSLANKSGLELKENDIWWQNRGNPNSRSALPKHLKQRKKKHLISEYGVNYFIQLGSYYDCGLYTDMAGIRKKLKSTIKGKEKVLNLFSYTGAFSLYPLSLGAKDVTSVDLSEEYMKWLEKNLSENDFEGSHTSITADVTKMIKKYHKNKEKFDLVVCDPPSSSSDGNSRTSSTQFYQKHLRTLIDITEDKGRLVLFLNTHSINRSQIKKRLQPILKECGAEIERDLRLNSDCGTIKGFPESDYLKGFIIKKS